MGVTALSVDKGSELREALQRYSEMDDKYSQAERSKRETGEQSAEYDLHRIRMVGKAVELAALLRKQVQELES